MVTKKTTATTTTNEAPKEKKTRKPREKRVRFAVLRVHPKYPEFLQALSSEGWHLIDPFGNWQAKLPLLGKSEANLAKAILGDSKAVKVIAESELSTVKADCFADTCCTDTLNAEKPCDAPELGNAGDIGLAKDAEFTDDDFSDDDDDDDFGDDDIEV